MALQMAGKVRLALAPRLNHFWQATFYVTPRGLTTGSIPMPGGGVFAIQFDFVDHAVIINTSRNQRAQVPLRPGLVAEFYQAFMAMLANLGMSVHIWTMPVEFPDPIRFDVDQTHASYDPDAAQRWWQSLVAIVPVFERFRAGFVGKCSPVHLFFGSMDLACTRFSGRRAPERPGADPVTRESYSHEVMSVGYWPGDPAHPQASFYAYAAPSPPGFATAAVRPAAAGYNLELGEYLLAYDEVRRNPDPEATLFEFCQSAYKAAADLGGWDRAALERS